MGRIDRMRCTITFEFDADTADYPYPLECQALDHLGIDDPAGFLPQMRHVSVDVQPTGDR